MKIKANIIYLYDSSNTKGKLTTICLRIWVPNYILLEEEYKSHNDYGLGLYYPIDHYNYKKYSQSTILKFLKRNFYTYGFINIKNHYNDIGFDNRWIKVVQELRVTIDNDTLERLKTLIMKSDLRNEE